jgi:predicted nuclease of restriction endonuclease-like (RecB) superfamily
LCYLAEAADQNWSTRTLERQINALYYERLLMSRDKSPVVDEMREKTAPLAATPRRHDDATKGECKHQRVVFYD